MSEAAAGTREREWWVPPFGPHRFRLLVGLSFYPYSLMNASYVLIGSLIAPTVNYDRMLGMAAVYILAVGVTAHSLDAMAPNRPWGSFLTRRQLGALAAGALIPALAIGLYYALSVALLLIPLGLAELFFLLAYNLELFKGTFHTDFWFATSWGFLPVLVGYIVQTNSVGLSSLWGGLFGFFTAYIEIKASRPYKALKREGNVSPVVNRLESILKAVVASVIVTAALLFVLSLQK
jgi:hypothetical protein